MTTTTAGNGYDANSPGTLRGNDWWEAPRYPKKAKFRAEEEKAAASRDLTLERFRELRYSGNRFVRADALALIADHREGLLSAPYANILAKKVGEDWMLIDRLPARLESEQHATTDM